MLTLDLTRRFLRERLILRSLVFPAALAILTIVITVGVVVWQRPPPAAAVTPEFASEAWLAEMKANKRIVFVTDDPRALVEDGTASLGTDGHTLWTGNGGQPYLPLEAPIRERLGTTWVPADTSEQRRKQIASNRPSANLMRFIAGLFAFYGVIFGAGSVARDTDEGTLDAELSTAIPTWVHGFARWAASTLVLSLFHALSALLFDSLLGVERLVPVIAHGTAAVGTATAIGLVVIGRAGMGRGFAGPMSLGLVLVVMILGLGMGDDTPVAPYLPIASVLAERDSLVPLFVSLLTGFLAAHLFAWRTTRT